MKTYILTIDVEQEEDGRWSAEVLDFPGCAAWGYTREEALAALQEGAQVMLEMMLEYGDPLPKGIEEYEIISESEEVTGSEIVTGVIAGDGNHRDGLIKTYILDVEIEEEEDGRWSADVPYFPGCAAWGYTKEEALSMLQEGAQALLEVIAENGHPIPPEVEKRAVVTESNIVAVTI